MEDGGRAITPNMILLAKLAPPQLFAFHIECDKSRRAQPGINALAVRHGRGRALGIGRVGPIGSGIVESGLPESLSVCAVKAHQRAAVLLFERLRKVNAITP